MRAASLLLLAALLPLQALAQDAGGLSSEAPSQIRRPPPDSPRNAPPAPVRVWEEGKHYRVITPAISSGLAPAGRIEVTEVFSYGCPFCYEAISEVRRLARNLPPDAVMTYVHASFMPAEAWPMFQRAFYTARSLGIAEANHDRLFLAIWEAASFPLMDPATGRVRAKLPTMEDAAAFYAKNSAVSAQDFLARSNSPEVEAQIRAAEDYIRGGRISGTPTIVVNGRYQVDSAAVGTWDGVRELVAYLISLERARLKMPTPRR